MSDSNKTLGVEEAFGTVFDGVHKRAFFHRLAQHGIVPQTEKEAEDLLGIGSKLVMASVNPALQQAAASESRFAKAGNSLNAALTEQGIIQPEKQATVDDSGLTPEAQAAAWQLAQDPEIFKSAEVLQAANEASTATAEQTT